MVDGPGRRTRSRSPSALLGGPPVSAERTPSAPAPALPGGGRSWIGPRRSLRNPAPRPRFTATMLGHDAQPRLSAPPRPGRVRPDPGCARSSSGMSTPSSRSSVSRRSVRTAGPSIAMKRAGEDRATNVVFVAQEVVGHHDDVRSRVDGCDLGDLVRTLHEHEVRGLGRRSGSGTPAGRPRRGAPPEFAAASTRGAASCPAHRSARRSGGSSTSTNARLPSRIR